MTAALLLRALLLPALLAPARAQTPDPQPTHAPQALTPEDEMIVNPEEVRFGFRGNARMQRSDLMEVIKSVQEQGLRGESVEVIRQRLLAHYQDFGFLAARVKAYTFEATGGRPKHVTYGIFEGPRYEISEIRFDGNQVHAEAELLSRYHELASPIIQQGFYSPTEAVKGAEALVQWMRSEGYLSAKYISHRQEIDDSNRRVKVTFYIYEGAQTLVREYRFLGLKSFQAGEVAEFLSLKVDQPFNPYAFSEGLEALKRAYRNRGYLSMSIVNEGTDAVTLYSNSNRWVDVELKIQEGERYRLGTIETRGLRETEEIVVTREVQIEPGAVLAEDKLLETEARLRRLALFSKITMDLVDDPAQVGVRNLVITLEEGQPGFIAGGAGLRNDLGIRLFGQIGYTNLWRKNHSWSLFGSTNRRFQDYRFIEYQVSINYVWPWVFWGPTAFRPSITQQRLQFIQLSTESTIFSASLDRKLLNWGNLTGILTYSLERTRQFNALDSLDNETLRIGALTPSVRVDFRDNPLSPTRGFYALVSYELAHPLLGSQEDPYPVGYTRLQMRMDYHVPVTRRLNWFLSFRSGFLRNLMNPNDYEAPASNLIKVPLFKQFALGGVNSVRGYRLQEINNQDQVIRGTQSYVNYRTQLDYSISGPLKMGPFLDAANLNTDRFSFGDLKYGVGIGIRYQTPVGPVNFDWGFKLNPPANTSTNEFYFSIGVI